MEVPHTLEPILLLHTITGQNLTIGINEEVLCSGLAWQKPPSAAYVVDQAQIEERPEPGLRVLLPQ
jgi:hypothetical protein